MARSELTIERIKAIHWLYDYVELNCWEDFESGIDQAHAQILGLVRIPRRGSRTWEGPLAG